MSVSSEQKVIFLDIDGVLATLSSQLISGKLIDQNGVDALQKILDKTNAKIVVSSTWRQIFKKRYQMKKVLDCMGLIRPKLYGVSGTETADDWCTPKSNSGIRGEEIQAWLNAHPDVTQYVILDDDSDMLEHQLERFIRIDPMVGINGSVLAKSLVLLDADPGDIFATLIRE